MRCDKVKELLLAYLDEEVDSSDRALIQAHLAECEACRQELAILSRVRERISQHFQVQASNLSPSPQAWSRLEVYYPSNSPNATPQPAPLEYFWENVRIEEFPTLAVPPQPNTYRWDEKWYGFCDCINRLYWEYWCQLVVTIPIIAQQDVALSLVGGHW